MKIQFLGAAEEVTGSCFMVTVGGRRLLVDCGLIQGRAEEKQRNRRRFPFDTADIDAVVLTHAHIDHSGKVPLLVKEGYSGPIFTHRATRDLCRVMLRDSAYLHEKEAEWENRKRERRHEPLVEPLYTQADAAAALEYFRGLDYREETEILPGVKLRLQDAGHILGAAIAELWLSEGDALCKVVFSGDIGQAGAPILGDPAAIDSADLVVMESTYGDRLHRSRSETLAELREIFSSASAGEGNILVPSFAVGRAQELMYVMAGNFQEWDLDQWTVYLDSPMAIEATEIYSRHRYLHDAEAKSRPPLGQGLLRNLVFTRTTQESMRLNQRRAGAIIIAGSGMCTGGRIKHHLKNHIWRQGSHLLIVGFQASGTLGRKIVDGAREITLWGERVKVAAKVHTVGGLSAHADQSGLLRWYSRIRNRPPVFLVHGEPKAQSALQVALQKQGAGSVQIATRKQVIDPVKVAAQGLAEARPA